MEILLFILNSVLLGIALAMDAFSVSLADGLADPQMKPRKIAAISGTFAFFQWAMPMIGWICVYYFVGAFTVFRPAIPYIALALLLFIGGKMVAEGVRGEPEDEKKQTGEALTFGTLIVQGIATSIDALSTGFTFVGSGYGFPEALAASLIIAAVTLVICIAGVFFGKKFGTLLAGRASILGGVILIAIGVEIFVKGVFFS